MTKLLHGDGIWEGLAKLRAEGPLTLATPYFTRDDHRPLELRRGDRVVLDISNVKSGSVQPREVARLRRQGVEFRHLENLHAKVYAAGSYAVIGSANWTKRSRTTLREAAVLVNDPRAVAAVRRWLEDVFSDARVVDSALLRWAKDNYESPKPSGSRASMPKPSRGLSRQDFVRSRAPDGVGYQILNTNHQHRGDEAEAMVRAGKAAAWGGWRHHIDALGTDHVLLYRNGVGIVGSGIAPGATRDVGNRREAKLKNFIACDPPIAPREAERLLRYQPGGHIQGTRRRIDDARGAHLWHAARRGGS
jgi:hypothetical protein